jgi:transposase
MTITNCSVERLDHLGIVAGVIKDLKIIELIDDNLGIYEGESLSAGETIAGMIINGLGFSNKPLSLTPLFFEHIPLELLFREGVKADDFNRFKLGRVLDRCHRYGTELLFSKIALNVCQQEKVDTRFNSTDTTSFVLTGDYLGKTDEDTVEIKLGYSKDHRPDLKQIMLEMMVCHDGGIPLLGKALNGNASDNKVFEERSKELIEQFKASETPRYLIADSKLYTESNAVNLNQLLFITRIPNTIKQVGETIDKALALPNEWKTLDDDRKMQTFNVEHYGIKQRWHVVSSETSRECAIKQVDKRVKKATELVEKQVFHFQARRFACTDDALADLQIVAKKWKYHTVKSHEIVEHPVFEGKGRPKKDQEPTRIEYQVIAEFEVDTQKINLEKAKEGHYVIGGNTDANELSDAEVIAAYKQQQQVERGFRFLKDPLFFASSLFLKNPKRIMALLMVMLLSLLVYGIAERRMRACLVQQKETLPNQIGLEIEAPTLRWVFQLLYGINYLDISLGEQCHQVVEGITPLKQKILRLFGKSVADIYQISYA